jgi:alanine-glyoxylate transaminase/serine-glyoxylate transaminase/serine-pyruvate transaminase
MNKLDNLKSTLLLGPGPSTVSPNVYKALSTNTIGHLDPRFIEIMDEIKVLLRYVYQTNNDFCMPVSGTGSAAMESCFVNMVDKGDKVLIIQNGYFGLRMENMCMRLKANIDLLTFDWGVAADLNKVEDKIKKNNYDIVAVVHAETSTGVENNIKEIGKFISPDTIFIVDAVTSLGTIDIKVDDWNIDAIYSCSQKGLSCPPGASPISFSDKALNKMKSRTELVPNWYLDMIEIIKYWDGNQRAYHHTAPINMMYALYQALEDVKEEGLKNVIKRHKRVHNYLEKSLTTIGLELIVKPSDRLPSLNAVKIPDEVDDMHVRSKLLNDYSIEIGGGLGPFAGKVWRIGLMGYSAYEKNVDILINAFKKVL